MKRIIPLFLCFIVFVSMLSGCGSVKNTSEIEIDKQSQQYINEALNIINKEWEIHYSENSDKIKSDKTVEIINTKVIKIKENNIEEFKDVDAVVEFDILSDFFGSTPYYSNSGAYDTVVFYKDGSTETINLFQTYTAKYYTTDFSNVIEDIIECEVRYNTNRIKTEKVSNEEKGLIIEAVEVLKNGWMEEFASQNYGSEHKSDGTVRIINTCMVVVNRESTHQIFDKYFGDVQAIVKFELYSDYFISAPYYKNTRINNTVIIHTDGTMELASDYIEHVMTDTFFFDFSQIFDKVKYFGDEFNETFNALEN